MRTADHRARWIAHSTAQSNDRAGALAGAAPICRRGNGHSDLREVVSVGRFLVRLGAPADVVGMVRDLLSAEASYVTGQVLTVDGGLQA